MLPLEMDKCCRKEGKMTWSICLCAYVHISDSAEAELVNTVQLKLFNILNKIILNIFVN